MEMRSVKVTELPPFIKQSRALFSEEEKESLKHMLAAYPEKGVVIPGTGGMRKLRVAAKGKGTRGGARVIYFYYVTAAHVYLLTCYGKNEREDISPEQKKTLRRVMEAITKE